MANRSSDEMAGWPFGAQFLILKFVTSSTIHVELALHSRPIAVLEAIPKMFAPIHQSSRSRERYGARHKCLLRGLFDIFKLPRCTFCDTLGSVAKKCPVQLFEKNHRVIELYYTLDQRFNRPRTRLVPLCRSDNML